MRIALLVTTFIFTLWSGSSFSDKNFSVRSGLWEMTTTSTNTLMPEPMVNVSEVCVENSEFNPEDMVQEMENCDVSTNNVTANSMGFSMTCLADGGEATIKGEYRVDGDKGEGAMSMNMKMGPVVMDVEVDWQSVYLGPSCPPE